MKEINLLLSRRFSKAFLNEFIFFFLLKMKKKLINLELSQSLVLPYFEVFSLKLSTGKNSSYPPIGRCTAPKHTKIIYDHTIAIINNFFKFHNDWLKIILIKYNCTQFCPRLLCKRNQKF